MDAVLPAAFLIGFVMDSGHVAPMDPAAVKHYFEGAWHQ
jgi:hypothetical protein